MNIFLDSVNLSSDTGPNGFAKKLAHAFEVGGHALTDSPQRADGTICFTRRSLAKKPFVQRLDGIYFNSTTNYENQNEDIKSTYRAAHTVIFQSEFDRRVAENFLGTPNRGVVIRNGTDLDAIFGIHQSTNPVFDGYSEVWSCASVWHHRPNKRLQDNIRFFHECAPSDACLAVCGQVNEEISKDRVIQLGHLGWKQLISVLKRSKYFVHLATVDHCPNVVVDARGCGCIIVCASLGGTEEIAGQDGIIIEDFDWDFKTAFDFKKPKKLDFSKRRSGKYTTDIDEFDILNTALGYIKVLEEVK